MNKIYDVHVEEVHSGDDLVLMVNLGVDGLFKRVRARLLGVDTPSAYKVKLDTEAGIVREKVKELVARGSCKAEVHSCGKGGWLVTLVVTNHTTKETVNVNDTLVALGYSYTQRGQTCQA